MPRSAKRPTEAEGGTYVVLVDRLREEIFAEDDKVKKEPVDELVYDKGEEIELSAEEAARHLAGGSVAKEGSIQARVAKGEVPAEFVPNPALSDEQLEVQLAAIQAVLNERQTTVSYDVSAEGGVDPTDPEAVENARGSDPRDAAKAAKPEGRTGKARSGGGAGDKATSPPTK